jgi:hypothetical protein
MICFVVRIARILFGAPRFGLLKFSVTRGRSSSADRGHMIDQQTAVRGDR